MPHTINASTSNLEPQHQHTIHNHQNQIAKCQGANPTIRPLKFTHTSMHANKKIASTKSRIVNLKCLGTREREVQENFAHYNCIRLAASCILPSLKRLQHNIKRNAKDHSSHATCSHLGSSSAAHPPCPPPVAEWASVKENAED